MLKDGSNRVMLVPAKHKPRHTHFLEDGRGLEGGPMQDGVKMRPLCVPIHVCAQPSDSKPNMVTKEGLIYLKPMKARRLEKINLC